MACLDKLSRSVSPAGIIKIIGSQLEDDHMVYIIKVSLGSYEWKVTHRYSEFCELNNILPSDVKETAKELLPKKKLFGSNSEVVVKERERKLETYLQCLFRSLNVIPHCVLQFLDFNSYEIHGITESLAEELYHNGDTILASELPYRITTLQMHAICQRMEILEPMYPNNSKKDIGHLFDVITQLKNLKVNGRYEPIGMSNVIPNELFFHFQHFKSLQSLRLENCNMRKMMIEDRVKKSLVHLKVSHSLINIRDVLMTDLQWENCTDFSSLAAQKHSWPSLLAVDFDSNNISDVDDSVMLIPNVNQLILSHNKLEKLSNIECLTSLKELNVSYNKLVDNFQLRLSNVTTVNVSHNSLTSLRAFAELTSLKCLNASFNKIESIDKLYDIRGLSNLVELKLEGNPIYQLREYRLMIFQILKERLNDIILDSMKPTEVEKDTVHVRLAIQEASENAAKMSKKTTTASKPRLLQTTTATVSRSDNSSKASLTSLPDSSFSLTSAMENDSKEVGLNRKVESKQEKRPSEEDPDLCFVERSSLDDKASLLSASDESDTKELQNKLSNPIAASRKTDKDLKPDKTSNQPFLPDYSLVGAAEKKDEMLACGGEGGVEVVDVPNSRSFSCQQELNNFRSLFTFNLGHQKLQDISKRQHSRRRKKYFLLPETLPNHHNRSFLNLLEDSMDPPDSFGLPELEGRHCNSGHVMWCTALTNLRKGHSSSLHERPVCVCLTPHKIHIFRVDQLRGDAGIPKLRYFSYLSFSDIRCFLIGYKSLYMRIVDRLHASKVVVLLTFNGVKTENFLDHVKKASRRNIPFLDEYEDPVVYNVSLPCRYQLLKFLEPYELESNSFSSSTTTLPLNDQQLEQSIQIKFFQLVQQVSPEDNQIYLRTAAVLFTNNFLYVVFPDFSCFPSLPEHNFEFFPSGTASHKMAAVFPLTSILFRIKKYDGDTTPTDDDVSYDVQNGNEFIGYGLKLFLHLPDGKSQVVDLRWPSSYMRREFLSYLNSAFNKNRQLIIDRSSSSEFGGRLHHSRSNCSTPAGDGVTESQFFAGGNKNFQANLSCTLDDTVSYVEGFKQSRHLDSAFSLPSFLCRETRDGRSSTDAFSISNAL